jgi:hypothetical protein
MNENRLDDAMQSLALDFLRMTAQTLECHDVDAVALFTYGSRGAACFDRG